MLPAQYSIFGADRTEDELKNSNAKYGRWQVKFYEIENDEYNLRFGRYAIWLRLK